MNKLNKQLLESRQIRKQLRIDLAQAKQTIERLKAELDRLTAANVCLKGRLTDVVYSIRSCLPEEDTYQ